MRITREFYIPKGAVKVADKNSDAVAYLYDNGQGPCAALFYGKQAKPVWQFRFKDAEQRAKRIAEGFASKQAWDAQKAEAKARRQAKGRGVEVGTLLKAIWGYEQTNVDYYQVTALIGKTMVEVRKVGAVDAGNGSEPWMTGKSIPALDNFIGEPMRRTCKDGRVKIDSVRSASVWDGRPVNWTAYA